jgi:glutathione S-transferase
MKLYGSLTSPYVRKARILIREKGLPCEFVVADAWAADSPVPALNPLGKVPVLVLDNNDVLFDSPVIVEYLDSLQAPALLAAAGAARWDMLRWEALADGVLDASVAARLEQTWSGRSAEQRCQAWIDRQMSRVQAALTSMSQGLGDKPWCTGNHLTLADVAVGCALGYLDFRFPQLDWRGPHANLAKLYDKLSLRQSFIDSRPPAA